MPLKRNYDLVLTGARICDPATGLDRTCDLAVTGDRIAAVGSGLASRARQVIELDGKLATAGWIDLHVHEWMTTFGLPRPPPVPIWKLRLQRAAQRLPCVCQSFRFSFE